MIKTILWDFDGVIFDSMKIKGDGFVELFKDYGFKYTSILEKYHLENGGVSRYDKIKYFFNNILEEEVTSRKINDLAEVFSQIIEEKIFNKENLINETLKYIEDNYKYFNFHIVSGADEQELKKQCIHFDIKKYFLSINGSPTKKGEIVKKIINRFDYKKDDTILIGDSINDYNAAKKNGISFYGYNNLDLKKNGFCYIDSFKGLKI